MCEWSKVDLFFRWVGVGGGISWLKEVLGHFHTFIKMVYLE